MWQIAKVPLVIVLLFSINKSFADESFFNPPPLDVASSPLYSDSQCKNTQRIFIENLFLDMAKELKLKEKDIVRLNQIRTDRDHFIRQKKKELENQKITIGIHLWQYFQYGKIPSPNPKIKMSTEEILQQDQEKLNAITSEIVKKKLESVQEAIKIVSLGSSEKPSSAGVMNHFSTFPGDDENIMKCLGKSILEDIQ